MTPEYKKYLLSPEWTSIKLDLFASRGRKCEICGSTNKIQVHHKTYKNIFNEEPEDLQVVCECCHLNIHFPKGKPTKKVSKSAKKKSKKNKPKKTLAQKVVVKKKKTQWRKKKRDYVLSYLRFIPKPA